MRNRKDCGKEIEETMASNCAKYLTGSVHANLDLPNENILNT